MSVFTLLYYLTVIILFIIGLIFLVTILPLNISVLSNIDGTRFDGVVDFSVLLGLLAGSFGFGGKGSSFRLRLFSLPVYNREWMKEERKQEEVTKESHRKKAKKAKPTRRSAWKLLNPVKSLLGSITRIIKVRKFDVDITAGLSDPYVSGLMFGFAYPLFELARVWFPPLSVSMTPVFVEDAFRAKFDGRISLRMILFVVPLLLFYFSREYREYRREGTGD
jgi:hypothetical protein